MNKRPFIPSAIILDTTKALEKFQNLTLRPIIKSLNDLLQGYLKNYILLKRFNIATATTIDKDKFITSAFLNDNQLKNEIKGMVIGHFSIEEFNFYIEHQKQINKRILSIVKQRVLSYY
ncbi:glyoxalase [Lutibacter sp. A80]|uniref:glyoxalase n=1 Tax=Lutibacter sp. A80 TaxID=2918453 RepID=UPI001F06F535|nr:glyoxalase [Lutibacter sp. A80]UMB60721.1 glyoxalase [Lutibacter sp. A80]